MDIRPAERERDYRDLRERTRRHEQSREESRQRIVELQRERSLHSFQAPSEAEGEAIAA